MSSTRLFGDFDSDYLSGANLVLASACSGCRLEYNQFEHVFELINTNTGYVTKFDLACEAWGFVAARLPGANEAYLAVCARIGAAA